jgi:hypothetical protein
VIFLSYSDTGVMWIEAYSPSRISGVMSCGHSDEAVVPAQQIVLYTYVQRLIE